jgi:hypothetical protein
MEKKANIRVVSTEENELIGEFKMAVGDVMFWRVGYEVHIHSNRN